MFVFGGVCEDKTTTNELYCFDFGNHIINIYSSANIMAIDKNTWELVKKLAVFRAGHSMVVLDKHIVIFGGADEHSNISNSVFLIDSSKFHDHLRCISDGRDSDTFDDSMRLQKLTQTSSICIDDSTRQRDIPLWRTRIRVTW